MMREMNYELVVIGGGPAGIAGAVEAYKQGIRRILILEREPLLGGILKQCIHNGFGLHVFKEELTGPEYAARWIDALHQYPMDVLYETTVLTINNQKSIVIVNCNGIQKIQAKNILLAMGCRERTRTAILTPGYRPAGILTAGAAQKLVNLAGYMPGRRIVIVGSGDIGLIMARRMMLEGANVEMVCEIMPYSSGLARNINQCVLDFDIPLRFSTSLVYIHGKERVSGVTIAHVDKNRQPIAGSEEFVACDTVLFSVGLIPENELSKQMNIDLDPITCGPIVSEDLETSLPGVYACGNVVHVHDLVDNVSLEAMRAARGIVNQNRVKLSVPLNVAHSSNIRYVVPQRIHRLDHEELIFAFRVSDVYHKATIRIVSNQKVLWKTVKPIVTPGEMITINLHKDAIAAIENNLMIEMEAAEDD